MLVTAPWMCGDKFCSELLDLSQVPNIKLPTSQIVTNIIIDRLNCRPLTVAVSLIFDLHVFIKMKPESFLIRSKNISWVDF